MYDIIDEMIKATKEEHLDGMLLDRYTASHYQKKNKLKSLVTVMKLESQRDVGILISKDKKELKMCLDFYRSKILTLVQTITDSYKVTFTLYLYDVDINIHCR